MRDLFTNCILLLKYALICINILCVLIFLLFPSGVWQQLSLSHENADIFLHPWLVPVLPWSPASHQSGKVGVLIPDRYQFCTSAL